MADFNGDNNNYGANGGSDSGSGGGSGGRSPRGGMRFAAPVVAAVGVALVILAGLLVYRQFFDPNSGDDLQTAASQTTAPTTTVATTTAATSTEPTSAESEYEGMELVDLPEQTDLPVIGLATDEEDVMPGAQPDGATTSDDPAATGETAEDIFGVDSNGDPNVATASGLGVSAAEFRYMLNYFKSGQLLNTGIEPGSAAEEEYWGAQVGPDETMLDYIKKRAISELADLNMFAYLANEMDMTLDDGDIDNINTSLNSQADRFGGAEELQAVLEDEYEITLAEYRQILVAIELRDKYTRMLRDDITVTSADTRTYYEEHKGEYETATVREIIFFSDGTDLKNPRPEEETQAMAEAALTRATAGEDMADLVNELSEDHDESGTGVRNNGMSSYNNGGGYVPAIAAWAFSAEPGDIGLVETSYGFSVVELVDIIVQDFRDVSEDIADIIRGQRLEETLGAWREDEMYSPTINEKVYAEIG